MDVPHLYVDAHENVFVVDPMPGGGCVRERIGTLDEVGANPTLIPERAKTIDLSEERVETLHSTAVGLFNAGWTRPAAACAMEAIRKIRERPFLIGDLPQGRESLAVLIEIARRGGGQ